MADQKELDRANRVADLIDRYYGFEDAVEVNKQNKEYLKTYIHDSAYVVRLFEKKSKMLRGIGIAAIAAAVAFLIALVIFGFKKIIIAGAVAGGVFIIGIVVSIMIINAKLKAAQEEQLDVNNGIKEQIDLLDKRTKQIEKQRDDYKKGLKSRLDFLSPDYIGNIGTIKEYLQNGEAETCEDAVALLEQNMLMQKMSAAMTKSSRKPLDMDYDQQKAKFGDPLAAIREKRKKKR
jgi:hypothetical protein